MPTWRNTTCSTSAAKRSVTKFVSVYAAWDYMSHWRTFMTLVSWWWCSETQEKHADANKEGAEAVICEICSSRLRRDDRGRGFLFWLMKAIFCWLVNCLVQERYPSSPPRVHGQKRSCLFVIVEVKARTTKFTHETRPEAHATNLIIIKQLEDEISICHLIDLLINHLS